QPAYHPLVQLGKIRLLDLLLRIETLEEDDHVEDYVEVGCGLLHLVPAEFQLLPDRVAHTPEPEAVGAVFVQDLLQGDELADGLAHLLALLVDEEAMHEYPLVRAGAVADDPGAEQRIEPSPYLVLAFYYQIRPLPITLGLFLVKGGPDGIARVE